VAPASNDTVPEGLIDVIFIDSGTLRRSLDK
jgi:hypothetical protein